MQTVPPVTATCVMSVPRYGNHLCRGSVEGALRGLNLSLSLYTGPFWHHVLTECFEKAVYVEGHDWILCFDHDTMVTTNDILTLLTHAHANKLDALAALQCKRNCDQPLFSQNDFPGLTGHVGDSIIEVDTAHFGCTAISCAALKKTRHPWFWEMPSPKGTWSREPTGRESEFEVHPALDAVYKWGLRGCDADIWFWRNWLDSGNKAWVDGSVRVGHMEETVAYYDQTGAAHRVHDEEWLKMREAEG